MMREHYLEVTYQNYLSKDYEVWFQLIMSGNTIISFFDSGTNKKERGRKFKISREINKEDLFEGYRICSKEDAIKFGEVNSMTFIKP